MSVDRWLPLKSLQVTGDGVIRAEFQAGPDCPWFDGHFPDQPLLPGLALLAFCLETLIRALRHQGRHIKIMGFKRIKFKQIVLPGQLAGFTAAARSQSGCYNLEMTCSGRSVLTGVILIREE